MWNACATSICSFEKGVADFLSILDNLSNIFVDIRVPNIVSIILLLYYYFIYIIPFSFFFLMFKMVRLTWGL